MTTRRELGLTQRRILRFARFAEQANVPLLGAHLVKLLKVAPNSIYMPIQRLGHLGLLEPLPDGGGPKPLKLTDRGRDLADQLIALDEHFPEHAKEDEKDVVDTTKILQRIAEAEDALLAGIQACARAVQEAERLLETTTHPLEREMLERIRLHAASLQTALAMAQTRAIDLRP